MSTEREEPRGDSASRAAQPSPDPSPAQAPIAPPTASGTHAEAGPLGASMIARGILGVVFGLATIFWPRESADPRFLSLGVGTVDALCIAYLALLAVTLIIQALRGPVLLRTPVLGQAIVTLPALVVLLLADQPAELRAALSIWAVLHGLLEVWNHRLLKGRPMSSDFLIGAGCHIILGVILIFGSDLQALSILGFTGAAALIAGVLFILGGYSRISRARAAARIAAAETGRR